MIERSQERFKPFDFETATLNLHRRADSRTAVENVVVFVHGFMGSGYGSWKKFPKFLFEAENPTVDVAVFHYFSGHRRYFKKRPSLQEVAKVLAEDIADLQERYPHIYLVAHSMGGLIAQSALRSYLDNHDRATSELKALAALFLFASPLEGSKLAFRLLTPLVREISILKENAKDQKDLRKFILNQVETTNLKTFGDRWYQIPIFSGYGQHDWLVTRDSATSNIVEKQSRGFPKGHIKLVKPTAPDDAQVTFVQERIALVTDRRERMRIQRARRLSAARNQAPASVGSCNDGLLVAELLREIDGHEWWLLYQDVIAEASTPAVRVVDKSQLGKGDIPADLLMYVSASENVLSRREDAVSLLKRAREEYESRDVDVRIVTVGHDQAARDAVSTLVDYETLTQKAMGFFVETAADGGEAMQKLRHFVAVLVAKAEERQRMDNERPGLLQIERL